MEQRTCLGFKAERFIEESRGASIAILLATRN